MDRPERRERSLRRYLDFVRFEHTLFALPFAYGGMLLAAGGWPGVEVFSWITLAMVGARTAAMALNRVIDADIDARNPRTRDREIPSGRLAIVDGVLLAVLGFSLLLVAGWALNPLTLALLPVAVVFLALYPYSKRFTWLCHLWLGVTIGAAAAGGWIAVTGAFAPAAVALWIGVGSWIAGFDIIYALLDIDFDRSHAIHSIPARFGRARARVAAAALHIVALLALVAPLPLLGLGPAYAVAWLGVAAVLWYQHRAIRENAVADVLRGFNANLYVGGLMLLGIVLDLLLPL